MEEASTKEVSWWEALPPDWYFSKPGKASGSVIELAERFDPLHPEFTKEENDEFRKQVYGDIPFFHKLYAKYGDSIYLEIIRNLGFYLSKRKP